MKKAPKKLLLAKETLRSLTGMEFPVQGTMTAGGTDCTWCYFCDESVHPKTCQDCGTIDTLIDA